MGGFSCCFGCTPETGRSAEPNCHMTCTKYITECAKNEKRKSVIIEAKRGDIQAVALRSASVTKAKRRSGKK